MQKTDWTKWSAIAEILSSVAIVATLLYLAIQTQQNAAAIQSSSRQTMLMADLEVLQMAPDELLFAKEGLTIPEMEKLQRYLIALVRSREFQWFQYRDGQLDREIWESYLGALRGNLSWPRTREWWDALSADGFDAGFVNEVNSYLSDTEVRKDLRHNFEILGID